MYEEAIAVLRNVSVLVVEDEPLVSMALVDELERADAFVVGPAASVETAVELARTRRLGGAILDIEVQGERIYPAADLLMARRVPFIFATGVDIEILPERFAAVPNSAKPSPAIEVLALLARRISELA